MPISLEMFAREIGELFILKNQLAYQNQLLQEKVRELTSKIAELESGKQ